MGWMQACIRTYDNNVEMAGKTVEGKDTLMPMFYMTIKAQLEVTLTKDGNFAGARELLDKKEQYTPIPVTEDSCSRSGKANFPHPLCDQLQYICFGAKDCPAYTEDYDKKYKAFIKGLRAWTESEHTHPKAEAVLTYCEKGEMYGDLVKQGIINADTKKLGGAELDKCLVRWIVLIPDDINSPTAVWEDENLREAYARYYISAHSDEGIGVCYATGETLTLTTKHPKGIVKACYGAKLISSNDSSNFTYRGRFITPEEALTVSEIASQKAHSALRWVAANQGVVRGGRTFVCWSPEGKRTPEVTSDMFANNADDDDEMRPRTMPDYSRRLKKLLDGYKNEFCEDDSVVMMIMDAATTGRLSVTYYNEYFPKDFFDRIEKWYASFCWYSLRFFDKHPYFALHSPSCRELVNLTFGTQQGEYITASDGVMKEQLQRFIHFMIDGQPISYDVVHLLTERASTPQAYSKGNYEKVLTAACAAVKKYHNDKEGKEVWTMALDRENKDRSYLFGRLLAVCEKAEQKAYSQSDNGRETNAMRYQSVFAQRPMHTWNVLEKALNPYFARLRIGSAMFYKNEISQIVDLLSESDLKMLNRPLGDTYLLGYYLERLELNTYTDKTDE